MPEERKKIIASRLKLARERAGLSQEQVAKLLNLHRPAISEIEAGRRKISADEISELAEIYDVEISWLLNKQKVEFDEGAERFELAAREFSKLKPEDAEMLLDFLSAIKGKNK